MTFTRLVASGSTPITLLRLASPSQTNKSVVRVGHRSSGPYLIAALIHLILALMQITSFYSRIAWPSLLVHLLSMQLYGLQWQPCK